MQYASRGRGSAPNNQPFYTEQSAQMPPQPAHHQPAHSSHPPAHDQPPKRKHIDWAQRTVRIELFIILLGCSLLLIAVSIFLALNNKSSNAEMDKVAADKWQAVFLNGGSSSKDLAYTTYFGHLKEINSQYYILQDVFYLGATTDKSGKQIQSLTKLGCEQLHAPYDQMVINRPQVAFWENVRDDGQLVKAIQTYKQKFPNGPKCPTTSSSSSTTPGTSTEGTNPTSSSTSTP